MIGYADKTAFTVTAEGHHQALFESESDEQIGEVELGQRAQSLAAFPILDDEFSVDLDAGTRSRFRPLARIDEGQLHVRLCALVACYEIADMLAQITKTRVVRRRVCRHDDGAVDLAQHIH